MQWHVLRQCGWSRCALDADTGCCSATVSFCIWYRALQLGICPHHWWVRPHQPWLQVGLAVRTAAAASLRRGTFALQSWLLSADTSCPLHVPACMPATTVASIDVIMGFSHFRTAGLSSDRSCCTPCVTLSDRCDGNMSTGSWMPDIKPLHW